MEKPIIGIVSNLEYVSKGSYQKEVHDVNSDYINMIMENGGVPVIIPFSNTFSKVQSFFPCIDGLLLIGGEDIATSCYSNSTEIKSERDEFEIETYKCFKRMKKPILGICRGLQLINVAEGGTLANIERLEIDHFIETDGWINYHEISVCDGTKLKDILKVERYVASSVHHQKIESIGKDIIVSSRASDGVVESIEVDGDVFIVGFQGHIEKCLKNFKKYNDVVRYFIKEASNGKS